jgi:6-phosphogluconolactonase (cycloisomerase 2 family)
VTPDRLPDPGPLYIGTYADAGGKGLQRLALAPDGLSVHRSDPGVANASFGVRSDRFGLHYLVDEVSEGAIVVLRERDEGWQCLARVSTRGAEPCYVALDRDESALAVANYASGSVALFRLDRETGLPIDPPQLLAHSGRGPNPDRQEGPHAHCVLFSPDQQWLYQVDLGADAILASRYDREGATLGDAQLAFAAPAGTGPRHLAFHPRLQLALLVSELASTLTILTVGEGELSAIRQLSTLPIDFHGHNLGGHLAVNSAGDRIYVSNRGHDSIAVFTLDEAGAATLLQHVPCGGASPRFFLLLEAQNRMIVANEEGHSLAQLAIADDGTLAPPSAVLDVQAPAFLFQGALASARSGPPDSDGTPRSLE